MTDLLLGSVIATAYVGLLVAIAAWAERREVQGRSVAANRLVYSLALTVYATTWTFYGSVGFAARTGTLFLTVYLGPTLCAALWWWCLRKLVRIKSTYHVTSLPDVLALRYQKSHAVALVATAILVCGLVPYIALQLKTMIATLGLVAGNGSGLAYPASGARLGPPLLVFLLFFTIAFGLRRVRSTERHPGLVVALAVESVVKLVAFLAAAVFVIWGLFEGPTDVFRSAASLPVSAPGLLGEHHVGTWLAHLVVSAVAVLLLPRQFHVGVVENSNEDHIRTAMWFFPAYLLIISAFALPLALGALVLQGSAQSADTFVLSLPLEAGRPMLGWLVFLGGFSAGTGMVVVETIALATMIANYVALPAVERLAPLRSLRRHVLWLRWAAAAIVLLLAFAFERAFGPRYDLASLGLIAFTAVLQLAPAVLGGLFWPGASKAGAVAGLLAGFGMWLYTILVPVLARTGWLPESILVDGPFGLEWLVPEGLFDLHTDPVTHAAMWTMIVNVGAWVIGSVLFPAKQEEVARAAGITGILERTAEPLAEDRSPGLARTAAKRRAIVELLAQYRPREEAEALSDACLARAGARPGRDHLTALQLAELQSQVETALASAIGAAPAHGAVQRAGIVTPDEGRAIAGAYGNILARLRIPPEELRRRIDYHRERERLLARDAANQRFLAGVSSLLAGSLDVEATVRTAVRLPIPHLADAALLIIRKDGGPSVLLAHVDEAREEQGRAALEEPGCTLDTPSVARALETGRAVTSRPAAQGWPDRLRPTLPAAVEVTVPLVGVGEPVGTLSLFGAREDRLATPEELALVDELARRLAIALENARLYREAEQAVRARDEFLAIASHELKAPLAPLSLRIDMLQRLVARGELRATPPARLAEMMRGAHIQVQRLASLVDDLLDLTRLHTKRFRLDVAPLDLAALVREVVEQHLVEATAVGCALRVHAPGPVLGTWDRKRMEQVLVNLLANALKYAPGSPVEIGVEAEGQHARVRVRDQGPGIASADQERVFRAFERADVTGSASGLGLGLYIVREIVKAHGGTVSLDSGEGAGTTFTVDLPRVLAHA
jgi:signal transduction histidine kinase/Na+/proline symporter